MAKYSNLENESRKLIPQGIHLTEEEQRPTSVYSKASSCANTNSVWFLSGLYTTQGDNFSRQGQLVVNHEKKKLGPLHNSPHKWYCISKKKKKLQYLFFIWWHGVKITDTILSKTNLWEFPHQQTNTLLPQALAWKDKKISCRSEPHARNYALY